MLGLWWSGNPVLFFCYTNEANLIHSLIALGATNLPPLCPCASVESAVIKGLGLNENGLIQPVFLRCDWRFVYSDAETSL
jgi:hypothetical protein